MDRHPPTTCVARVGIHATQATQTHVPQAHTSMDKGKTEGRKERKKEGTNLGRKD